MYDLKDVTFLIPLKIDQEERFTNLCILIKYLDKYFDTHIVLGENTKNSSYNKITDHIPSRIDFTLTYTFIKEDSPYFNRMKVINEMVSMAKTPIIVIQDIDTLLFPEQYIEARNKISKQGYDLIYPYDGNFYTVPKELVNKISQTLSVEDIDISKCTNMRSQGNSVGGILFWNKYKFLECGGGNEKFISWGFDDIEMYERAVKLRIKIDRCKKCLFHLWHNPSLNSLNGSHPYYKNNEQEWLKVKGMTEKQLVDYIKTWKK